MGIFLKLEIKLRPRSCFDRSSGLNTAFEPWVWVGSDYGGGLPWVFRPFDGPDTYPRNLKPKAGAGRTPRNATMEGRSVEGLVKGPRTPQTGLHCFVRQDLYSFPPEERVQVFVQSLGRVSSSPRDEERGFPSWNN